VQEGINAQMAIQYWAFNMEYIEWKRVLLYLVILEFVVSIAALLAGHLTGNRYFDGVGVGLLIAWVTGVLAYLINTERAKSRK
jgi:hypothetical protein